MKAPCQILLLSSPYARYAPESTFQELEIAKPRPYLRAPTRPGAGRPLKSGHDVHTNRPSDAATGNPPKIADIDPLTMIEFLQSLLSRMMRTVTRKWRGLLVRASGRGTRFSFAARADGASGDCPNWSLLAAEKWETAKSIVVRIEIPGMEQADFSVQVQRGFLRIRGEKRSDVVGPGGRYHLMERAFGKFERRIALPSCASTEDREVAYRNGVLTVIVPKTEPLPPGLR
jgi:HSP20 family protein